MFNAHPSQEVLPKIRAWQDHFSKNSIISMQELVHYRHKKLTFFDEIQTAIDDVLFDISADVDLCQKRSATSLIPSKMPWSELIQSFTPGQNYFILGEDGPILLELLYIKMLNQSNTIPFWLDLRWELTQDAKHSQKEQKILANLSEYRQQKGNLDPKIFQPDLKRTVVMLGSNLKPEFEALMKSSRPTVADMLSAQEIFREEAYNNPHITLINANSEVKAVDLYKSNIPMIIWRALPFQSNKFAPLDTLRQKYPNQFKEWRVKKGWPFPDEISLNQFFNLCYYFQDQDSYL